MIPVEKNPLTGQSRSTLENRPDQAGTVVRLNVLANQLGYLPGGDKRFVVEVGSTAGKGIMSINNKKAPLDNPKVRQAVAYAIDRLSDCANAGGTGCASVLCIMPSGSASAGATRRPTCSCRSPCSRTAALPRSRARRVPGVPRSCGSRSKPRASRSRRDRRSCRRTSSSRNCPR